MSPQARTGTTAATAARYTDQGVDGDAALPRDEHRVHVELLDLGDGRGEQSEPVDEIDDRVDGELGPAPEAVEQRGQSESIDGAPGGGLGDGGDEHDPVIAQLPSTPPAPTTTSGPNAGSRMTPTRSSIAAACWAWTMTPRRPSPKRRSKRR